MTGESPDPGDDTSGPSPQPWTPPRDVGTAPRDDGDPSGDCVGCDDKTGGRTGSGKGKSDGKD